MKDIKRLYSHFIKHPKISTDSRKEVEGTIFFALSGQTYNGNRFAKAALNKGAALAVVDDPSVVDKQERRFFFVPDVLKALQELAIWHRKQFQIPLLGITGTNGKTTTKELIFSVLKTQKETVCTQGNLNNHIGVPITLLSLKPTTEIAVLEMGANHPGEIEALCRIANLTHGIITNIGKAHLEGFGSYEAVIKTKNELYESIRKSNGVVFFNQNDTLLQKLSEGIQRISYGASDAEITGRLLDSKPFLSIQWNSENGTQDIQTKLYGNYNFNNVMAAIAVGRYFGITTENIKLGIENYIPKNNRSQIVKTARNTIILDAYNANPGSMLLAIENFSRQSFDNKILILGDMFELGKYSKKEHQKIIDLLKDRDFKQVIFVGKDFFSLPDTGNYTAFKTTEEAGVYLSNRKLSNHTILIKGSRGMQLETLVKYL